MNTSLISRVSLALVLLLLVFNFFQIPKLNLDGNVFNLFPDAEPNLVRDEAERKMSEHISDKIYVLIAGIEFEELKSIAREYAEALESSPLIKRVVFEQSPDSIDNLADLYRRYPASFVSENHNISLSENPSRLIEARLKEVWINPGQLSSEKFIQDPMGFSDHYLKQAASRLTNNLTIKDGVLVHEDDMNNVAILVQVVLADSSFSISTQKSTYALFENLQNRFSTLYPSMELTAVGTFFFSYSGAQSAQEEISTVGFGSIIGILLLLMFVFRSIPVMFYSLLPAVVGVLTGMSVVNVIFSNVHMVTLVFGASLIGVSIDYSFHFLTTRLTLGQKWNSLDGLSRIISGLSMGLFTSASAYLCFIFSGFPGFKQIAVFSSVGLLSAYLFVVGFFPLLMKHPARFSKNTFVIDFCLLWLRHYSAFWKNYKSNRLGYVVVGGLLGFLPLGVAFVSFGDDIRKMQALDVELLNESSKFAEITGQKNGRRYFLVSGDDEDGLFEHLNALRKDIRNSKLNVELQSVDQWLFSSSQQNKNHNLIQDTLVVSGELSLFLGKLGVHSEVVQDIVANYQQTGVLTLKEAYPVIQKVAEFPGLFGDDGGLHAIVIVHGSVDSELLSVFANEHVMWVDTVNDMNSLLVSYRIKSIRLLIAAYVLVLIFLCIRYGIAGGLSVVAPPALATAVTLVFLNTVGSAISIFHIMAMLLILGIGIDYTIFLRESRQPAEEVLFAIGLSVVTTILAFGLLSLSATAAIHGFGLTLLIGIVVCFLLSPFSLKAG